jgi:hypothetical protein
MNDAAPVKQCRQRGAEAIRIGRSLLTLLTNFGYPFCTYDHKGGITNPPGKGELPMAFQSENRITVRFFDSAFQETPLKRHHGTPFFRFSSFWKSHPGVFCPRFSFSYRGLGFRSLSQQGQAIFRR